MSEEIKISISNKEANFYSEMIECKLHLDKALEFLIDQQLNHREVEEMSGILQSRIIKFFGEKFYNQALEGFAGRC